MASRKLRAVDAAPAWATAILQQIAVDYDKPEAPPLQWRTSTKHVFSSGSTFAERSLNDDGTLGAWRTTRIVVTAGTSGMDQLHVLLHEAAHWLAGHEAHHNARYYRTAFELYKRYKVPMLYQYERECGYKQVAMTVGRSFVAASDRFTAIYWRMYSHWAVRRLPLRTYNPAIHDDGNSDPAWNILFKN